MAVTSTAISNPGMENRIAGTPVSAIIRRNLSAIVVSVTAPDYSTGPILRASVERSTIYVEGAPGDQFSLEACYYPVFVERELAKIDEASSKWVSLGVATIPTSGTPVVKQTIADMAFALRVVRISGTGDFTVYAWGML